MKIKEIESRFIEISNIDVDLSIFPLLRDVNQQVKTNKDKSKAHGEVFTPLWLCDKMILKNTTEDHLNKKFLDLCAGYGQYSIRYLRYLENKYSNIDVDKVLRDNIYFSEIQEESCNKLMYIFGKNINLFIGDSRMLPLLAEDARGIWKLENNTWRKS